MATTTNYDGRTFKVPTTRTGLENLLFDSESDECTLTFDQLVACGVTPPAGTESYSFTIAMGDLCAYSPSAPNDAEYVLDENWGWSKV